MREQVRRRRTTDPNFKLLGNLRTRLYAVLRRGQRSGRTLELLGCTVPELWTHLEQQFRDGMTRENHGTHWEVDHVIPCAAFDLSDPAQQRECFHWTNLQPLLVIENRIKQDKLPDGTRGRVA